MHIFPTDQIHPLTITFVNYFVITFLSELDSVVLWGSYTSGFSIKLTVGLLGKSYIKMRNLLYLQKVMESIFYRLLDIGSCENMYFIYTIATSAFSDKTHKITEKQLIKLHYSFQICRKSVKVRLPLAVCQ